MSKSNVLNHFEQPASPSGDDNKLVLGGSVETKSGQSLKKVYLTVDMTDISTPATVHLPSPVAGTITDIRTVINNSIASSNAAIAGKIGTTLITNGVVTIPFSGSAAGDVNFTTPTALNIVAVGDDINFTSGGASANTSRATIVVEITLS